MQSAVCAIVIFWYGPVSHQPMAGLQAKESKGIQLYNRDISFPRLIMSLRQLQY